MPWSTRKGKSGKWEIVRDADGKVVGQSESEEDAKASVRARYAGEAKKRAIKSLAKKYG